MTYRIVPRTEIGLPAIVVSANGQRRGALRDEPLMIGHYTGVNTVYRGRDVPAQVRHIQSIFAATKPFEYNYVIGQTDDDAIYEFAGKFQAAHSGGENHISVGVLFLNGVHEPLTPQQIDKWQWLRDVLIFDGALNPNVVEIPHGEADGAATACPGAFILRDFHLLLRKWQPPKLVAVEPAPVVAPVTAPEPTEEEDTMLYIAKPAPTPEGKVWFNDATKWFAAFASGRIRRAFGPDVDYAAANDVPTIELRSVEHWQDMDSRDGK